MKKIIKIIPIFVVTFFIILVIFAYCNIFKTKIEVTNVSEYTNPANNYTVLLQAIGDPEWPFGKTKVKITLLDGNKKELESVIYFISDDGARASEKNVNVKWFDNYAEITISGSEQDDDVYKMYYKK
ncbi:MAG: hypothetical protein K0S41_2355 [Anaerocolumna sp.]|jgi:hypothetical protein|nr:hypothetical protein [Anaerocolumna sp.]